MAAVAPTILTTSQASYSFYLPSTQPDAIAGAASVAEALTLRGRGGPAAAREALGSEWDRPLLFDCACYEGRASYVNPEKWLEEQARAGADRLLTPGTWVPWSKTDDDGLPIAIETEWKAGLYAPGSTLVLAIDSRCLGKRPEKVIDALADVGQPVALVLAHRDDPLSGTGVLDGLLGLLRRVPNITLLRSDHGAIGAVSFGAVHGSIGLTPTYRHFVPPGGGGGGKGWDRTPRVFVWDLMDWFTAATIAGWGATAVRLRCRLACCKGETIHRFFDPLYEAEASLHNQLTLRTLAEYVLDEDPFDRRRAFATLCDEAVQRYGPMGKMSDIIEPRAQLLQWAQWA